MMFTRFTDAGPEKLCKELGRLAGHGDGECSQWDDSG